MKITPSLLYDYLMCPHKVWRDKYGPQAEKSTDDNPFLQMLWAKGVLHEKNVIDKLGDEVVDVSDGTTEERIAHTEKAITERRRYIYQGVISYAEENLFGIPDLLELIEDNYYPTDIKSGNAFEGADEQNDDDGKPKKHYAVQLAMYSEILIRKGLTKEHRGFIIDGTGNKTEYNLDQIIGVRSTETYWSFYQRIKSEVIDLLLNKKENVPALAGVCKLCPWYSSCKAWVKQQDDPTQIFYLGRNVRDILKAELNISTLEDITKLDVEDLIAQKKANKGFLRGVGENTLRTIQRRANVFKSNNGPILMNRLNFPKKRIEVHWDIEDNPLENGFVYLHGVLERSEKGERFIPFVAKENNEDAEKQTWKEFLEYIRSLPKNDFCAYYYSAHEKSVYKHLQVKYPDVISLDELNEFFENENTVDLYKIILQNTEWPLSSYGLKAISGYLGFKYRDETPSGALSIQWYTEYLKDKDPEKLKRILEYNEDDCRASAKIKDALDELNNRCEY